MISYVRSIQRPLKWVPFPRLQYFFGLILDAMVFPMEQIGVGLMQKFLVNGVEYQDKQYMIYVYWLAFAILFMVFVLNPLADCRKEYAMQVYTANLRELTMDRLLTCKFSFFESYQTGELMTRLRDDLNTIPSIYTESVFRFLLGVFYGGGSLFIMCSFCWQLALIVIILCVLEFYLVAAVSEKIEKKTEMLQKIVDKQQQMLFDILRNLRFIKIFSITSWTENRFHRTGEKIVEKKLEINNISVILNLLTNMFEAVNLILIFSFGVMLYLRGRIDLGSVMAFLFLQDGIAYMFGNFRDFFAGMSAQEVSCKRVEELLIQIGGELQMQEKKKGRMNKLQDTMFQDEKDLPGTQQGISRIKPEAIYIRNLSFRYPSGNAEVLSNVNLTIPKGKITVLHGVSGSGKSTLLKLILGLYQPQNGSISIGETDYRQMDSAGIRSYYAYVEQSPYLFHDTVAANIRGSASASLEEVAEAARKAGAHDFIMQKKDGYQTVVSEQGDNFSGGEKQRLAIARAILRDAAIVILDEATSGVDWEKEREIHEQLQEMARQGKTVLIVTHREHTRLLADFEISL